MRNDLDAIWPQVDATLRANVKRLKFYEGQIPPWYDRDDILQDARLDLLQTLEALPEPVPLEQALAIARARTWGHGIRYEQKPPYRRGRVLRAKALTPQLAALRMTEHAAAARSLLSEISADLDDPASIL